MRIRARCTVRYRKRGKKAKRKGEGEGETGAPEEGSERVTCQAGRTAIRTRSSTRGFGHGPREADDRRQHTKAESSSCASVW